MKNWHWMLLALVSVASLIAQFVGEEGHGPWAQVPAFWALFGFLGCALIILVSKAIGKYFLQRREDYYDEL